MGFNSAFKGLNFYTSFISFRLQRLEQEWQLEKPLGKERNRWLE